MPPHVLFSGKVPVAILHPPSTSPSALLAASTTPLTAHLTHSPASRTLTLTISDLSTRLLLLKHTLTTDGYHELREAQSLRIDFSAFPAHLADLLSRPGSDGFLAALIVPEQDDSPDPRCLRLVQLNRYKAITHVELPLQPADPSELLAALSARARDADAEHDAAAETARQLRARDEDLRQRDVELADARGELAQLRQRTQRLDEAVATATRVERDADALRDRLQQREERLVAVEHERDAVSAERAQARSEVAALRERLQGVMEAREATDASGREMSVELEALRVRFDEARAEIRKGNVLIEKLQGEVIALRAKGRVKSSILAKQDAAVQELDARVARLERETRRARDRAAMLEVEKEGVAGQLAAARSKLEENAAVLASDQQVIAYLNRELNESVIGSGRRGGREDGGRRGGRSKTPSPTGQRGANVQVDVPIMPAVS